MWIVIVGSSSSERLTDVGTNEVVSMSVSLVVAVSGNHPLLDSVAVFTPW